MRANDPEVQTFGMMIVRRLLRYAERGEVPPQFGTALSSLTAQDYEWLEAWWRRVRPPATKILSFSKGLEASRIELSGQRDTALWPDRICFSLSRRCPLACSHCFLSCSLDGYEGLGADFWCRMVEECAGVGIKTISISGGEPFFDLGRLKAIVNACHTHQCIVWITTSGYWANSRSRAREVLSSLGRVSWLFASYDPWHLERMPEEHLHYVCDTCREAGVPFAFNITYCSHEQEEGIRTRLRERFPGGDVCGFPITPVGRAALFDPSVFEYSNVDRNFLVPCGNTFPVIEPDGDVAACCGDIRHLGKANPLQLASARSLSMRELLGWLHDNALVQILRVAGVVGIVEWATQRGVSANSVKGPRRAGARQVSIMSMRQAAEINEDRVPLSVPSHPARFILPDIIEKVVRPLVPFAILRKFLARFLLTCEVKSDSAVPVSLQESALRMVLDRSGPSGIVLTVRRSSMFPTIRHGERVVAVEANSDALQIGDVVIFASLSGLVVHRIVATGIGPRGARMVQTRGDNRFCSLDPPIPEDRVICRVSCVLRPRSLHLPKGGKKKP